MIIAFVPIRCGSKSITHKNIKNFCGRPLIYWVLEALEKSKVDCIYVATDCEEFVDIVSGFGFSKIQIYHREPENAQDSSSTESVMLEFLKNKENNKDKTGSPLQGDDIFILIQATSPFLTSTHIDLALKKYLSKKSDSMLSAVRFKRFLWSDQGKAINYDYRSRPRRQEFEGALLENGAFYINRVSNILRDKNRLSGRVEVYEMPEFTYLEMDEPVDWEMGEALMRQHQKERVLGSFDSKKIKLFLCDVDGTLTDGGMYYSEKGEILKKFNTVDGMGLSLLKKHGILRGLITKENSPISQERGKKLKLDFVFIGVDDKLNEVKKLCKKLGISLHEVAYIGDDINDLELLEACGLSAAPSDGNPYVKNRVGIVLSRGGGKGCVREFVDIIIKEIQL